MTNPEKLIRLCVTLSILHLPSLAFAGGIEIDERSVAFDNDPVKRAFAHGTEIVMTFASVCVVARPL